MSQETVHTEPLIPPVRTVIQPTRGWVPLRLAELWQYRELLWFLVWREIKGRYSQSVLGIGWAVIQPVFSMIVFTLVFGNLAQISSDGVPYAIFSYTALVPWTYFSDALVGTSGSLITSAGMMQKVYFPRLIIPITPAASKLVDFGIAMLILVGLMFWFKTTPGEDLLVFPLLIPLMILSAIGPGLWLTALAIQYRDIKYGMSFLVRMLMYVSPVVYPTSMVPEKYRLVYGINPMAGVIEGFRAALLGTVAMPWDLLGVGSLVALGVALGGAFYFKRMERNFADVA